MRRILIRVLLIVLTTAILLPAGCAAETESGSGTTGTADTSINASSDADPSVTAKEDLSLPAGYPKELLPLAADAEIIDVRENPANNGLEVMYVSRNDIDTLRDFYEGALRDTEDPDTIETEDGYMITANTSNAWYTVMLSREAMNGTAYDGMISVYLILTGITA